MSNLTFRWIYGAGMAHTHSIICLYLDLLSNDIVSLCLPLWSNRDAKALQEKTAKKAAQAAGGSDAGGKSTKK